MKNLADAYRQARKVDPKGFRSNTNIAHRVGAEARVELELMKYARKVLGKARLLYQLAKAAKGTARRRGQGRHLSRGRRETFGGHNLRGRGG